MATAGASKTMPEGVKTEVGNNSGHANTKKPVLGHLSLSMADALFVDQRGGYHFNETHTPMLGQ